jgi:hypothetical protein
LLLEESFQINIVNDTTVLYVYNIYKAINGELLVVLTQGQKLIFEHYIQTLFNKDLFFTIIYRNIEEFRKITILFSKSPF